MALINFNAAAVEPAVSMEPLPAGDYVAVIVDSDMKMTKKGDGQYLDLAFQVADGPFKGRYVWAKLNIENPNEVSQRIGQAELSAICHAVNVMQPRNSEDLHNRPMVIRVKYVPENGNYSAKNEIKGYKRLDGVQQPVAAPAQAARVPAAQPSQQAPARQAAPAQSATPVWNR